MSKDLAALSSGDKTAFRSALRGMSYMTPILSIAILTPVEFVDIELPAGYDQFILEGIGLGASDQIAAGLSFDGGTTFISDVVNNDTYANEFLSAVNTGSITSTLETLSLMKFYTGDYSGLIPGTLSAKIFPGTDALLPHINFTSSQYDGSNYRNRMGSNDINPASTVPPTAARATHIRVLPFGDGNANVPAGWATLNYGTFYLFGMPTPE